MKSNQDVELFRQLFSDEGDKQRRFWRETKIDTADVLNYHKQEITFYAPKISLDPFTVYIVYYLDILYIWELQL